MAGINSLRSIAMFVTALLLSLAFALVPAKAAPNHMRASLLAEGPVLPGQTVTLALLMQPEKGWHGYWSNPGDAGYGLTLDWTLPPGASTGAMQFPVPQTLLIQGLMNHVYEHEYAVLVPFTVPATATPGTLLPVNVRAQWLVCTETICVPERADLEGAITIGTGAKDTRFEPWRAALPAPLDRAGAFAIGPKSVRVALPFPASAQLEAPHLFLSTERLADYAAPQRFFRDGDTLVIEVPLGKASAAPAKVEGVLAMGKDAGGIAFTTAPGPVPTGGDEVGGAAFSASVLGLALLGAFLGGLVLNVMPCVFPILSLKALALARGNSHDAKADGLAYTGGVVLACLALGGVMLGLRAGGEQVGWAFQLQEPGVIAVLLLLAAAITANFAGLYELPGLSIERGAGRTGAFGTGLLAAFVATPCTGPFMAAAMGAALVLPWWAALGVFAALGLGLALPFLALGFVPPLRRLLPKPGAWMDRFRRIMAVPMGLTALALGWLAWRVGGATFTSVLVAIAVMLIAALAAVGVTQRKGQSTRQLMAICALIAIGGVIGLPPASADKTVESGGLLAARPFSEAALAEARRANKPVFAYFTADWCLSCKVNESTSIERETTRAAFEKAGVVVLVGDWTRRDPAITKFLTAQGVAGVPLYLWYPAGGGNPRQLPQVLTPDLLAGLPAQ
ncbi:protein-disulfide reductase DsbD domain-containing protein [Novosphingobium sp. MMS21-SN21R]|uniref:protein-disulfide reductase DsbD family protein n=1 Tax=Novosphingobium sp. MMS21-SN21R TaxID=2969298 RepID=UPI002888E212|nr:protein-disulfide reductase DsbD domain-containing protein [Novosphingobium sp. MMS21-SN21R]MDT0509042.1 protein-disulfide reductase DsbD family protein [Novosphingobium sp. MMS21-SN21R]